MLNAGGFALTSSTGPPALPPGALGVRRHLWPVPSVWMLLLFLIQRVWMLKRCPGFPRLHQAPRAGFGVLSRSSGVPCYHPEVPL